MILAGDLGGTKCTLILFEAKEQRLQPLCRLTVRTAEFLNIEDFFANFLRYSKQQGQYMERGSVTCAGFGVAGAVVNEEVVCNNLPWSITRQRIAEALQIPLQRTLLLNDVEAAASSLTRLENSDLLELNAGVPQLRSRKLYIAAGTGLGESILFWNRDRYQVSPCEAGLSDFAPGTDREMIVLRALRKRMARVCTEEIVSGRGFRAIHESLFPDVQHSFFSNGADAAANITQHAFASTCQACVESLHIWTQAYGSEAGNMALRTLPFGGVYIGGGIALKILPKLKDGTFVQAFRDKTLLSEELARIPIFVVLNQDAPVLGAAYAALAASTQ